MSTSSSRTSDRVLRSTVLPGSIVCSRTLSSMQELTNCEHARARARGWTRMERLGRALVVPACICMHVCMHMHICSAGAQRAPPPDAAASSWPGRRYLCIICIHIHISLAPPPDAAASSWPGRRYLCIICIHIHISLAPPPDAAASSWPGRSYLCIVCIVHISLAPPSVAAASSPPGRRTPRVVSSK